MNINSLIDLVKSKAQESNSLEFKRAESLLHAKNKSGSKKDELAKDVTAMANSNGGLIIYGIQEYDNGIDKCKAEKFDFLTDSNINEEWLEQVLNSKISPRIENLKIDKIEFQNEGYVIIIDIPKGNTAHQALDKKQYFKRYNYQSIAMDDWEVKDVINRQDKSNVEISLISFKTNNLIQKFIEPITIQFMVHNTGMFAANHINCFIELAPEHGYLVNDPKPNFYQDRAQITFSNKVENNLKIEGETISLPSYFDPLLPQIYKQIGKIEVSKKFFEKEHTIICKVATENTYKEFKFKTSEIEIHEN